MPDRCYVCQLVRPRKECAFHCWCYNKNDVETPYRGICDACYAEKGDGVFDYIKDPENHHLTKNHKYGPDMDEYNAKYKLPSGGGWEISFKDGNIIYKSLKDGSIYIKPPPPKCICCSSGETRNFH